jgi:hypothetical protein
MTKVEAPVREPRSTTTGPWVAKSTTPDSLLACEFALHDLRRPPQGMTRTRRNEADHGQVLGDRDKPRVHPSGSLSHLAVNRDATKHQDVVSAEKSGIKCAAFAFICIAKSLPAEASVECCVSALTALDLMSQNKRSVVSFQLSVISCRFPVVSCQLPVASE